MTDIVSPGANSLERPPEKGRFSPNAFNDGGLRDKPLFSELGVIDETTPAELSLALKRATHREGFAVVQEDGVMVLPRRHLPAHQGIVTGVIVAERNLQLDRTRSGQWDRRRWIAMGAGVPVFAIGISDLLIGTPHLAIPLIASLALLIVGAGMLAIPLATIGDAEFWSDLVVAKYEGTDATSTTAPSPASVRGRYRVDVVVGRAMTENWQSKVEKGRAVKTVLPDSSKNSTRSALCTELGIPDSPAGSARLPD
jgi:hypothetical protein